MAIENSDTDSSGNIRIRMRALQPKLQEAHPDLWTKFAWANFPSVVPILPPSAVLLPSSNHSSTQENNLCAADDDDAMMLLLCV